MADLTVTAADVRPLPGCKIRRFTAGAAIDVGNPVYLSAADTVQETDGSAAATAACIGVVVATAPTAASTTAAAEGEQVDVCLLGPVAGYTCTYGKYYYVDDDAGVMADAAGSASVVVGLGLSASVLLVRPMPVTLS
jgi:predicted RecA/RadA family phage recombinase